MRLPLSEALALSVLGMVVVFIVLVFLLVIICLLTFAVKRRKDKTSSGAKERTA